MSSLCQKKIGVLGGGQLSRMMLLKAHEKGFFLRSFSEKSDDPSAQVDPLWFQGKISENKKLKKFIDELDIVTFENEFIDIDLLKKIKSKKTKFYPSLNCMKQIQHRFYQKKLLKKHKLPTLDFMLLKNKKDLTKAQKKFPNGLVLKKNMFAYDAYGTFFFKDSSKAMIKTFKEPFYIAESYFNFKRELSLIAVRNTKKQIIFLPLCETYQKKGKCLWVKGPEKNKNIKKLQKKITYFLNEINYVGVIAFELFEDQNKELIINELAPRVHNSGHHSLDSLSTDQFSYHLQAIAGMKLKEAYLKAPAFCMLNLIGSGRKKIHIPLFKKQKLYWYGKKENKKGRKMAHLNLLEKSSSKALKILLKSLKEIRI